MWSVEGGNVFIINLAAMDMGGLFYWEPVYCHSNTETQKASYFISARYAVRKTLILLCILALFTIKLLYYSLNGTELIFFRLFVLGRSRKLRNRFDDMLWMIQKLHPYIVSKNFYWAAIRDMRYKVGCRTSETFLFY